MTSELGAPPGTRSAVHRVGWLGAGKMGAPMIRNLLVHGTAVAVTEPMELSRTSLVAAGATEARSLSDHADADIVFATLPNDDALLEVVMGSTGKPGLADTMRFGTTFVELSTVSPDCSKKVSQTLENMGIYYLRAPVSGSTALAEKAALTILASGDQSAWDVALPYLEMISSRRFYLGPGEEARYMKLVVNMLVGATSAILAEALSLGESGGLSRESMMEVIGESAVASPLLKYKTETVVSGDYDPAFTVAQMIKDFSLIQDAANDNGVPQFVTGLILELYRAAANSGLKEADFFALVKWHASMSR